MSNRTVILYDIDSKIPNLALMKLSAFHKDQGDKVILCKDISYMPGDIYYASSIFYNKRSQSRIRDLKELYKDNIDIGGSGIDLEKRLHPEIEACFPDYSIYGHSDYAIGFLTRGCDMGCRFCLVPRKEGEKRLAGSLKDFLPDDQDNVMLLDDNLLSFPQARQILSELRNRKLKVNFSQSLDIRFLDEDIYETLQEIDSRNARFTKRMFYFSCNSKRTTREFYKREALLKGFGKDSVGVIVLYGFDTHLSEDHSIMIMLRKLGLIPFFQEYNPIQDVPANVPEDFFDMDLDEVIGLRFRSNGQNWEKYLRWLNRLYFKTFGKYYLPLLRIIYRYNNKEGINRYLKDHHLLSEELYK
jgi:radical SAM superfamily enzyme YgiQ (UPF0313 family)